ncbi:tetratricopeptide repeat protein [Leptothermofonsia sichuanensis E412]|uniref:O-linked N-acetylglucosamine transferase family protein n=1 Tax=Leptothermofonsia sichuanensis TaxID=2917832 RepID=UPI001CA64682|nr:tetratricopeptide repeat protein [Leptothermofonsia sichuanensis]QZZ19716.1 tetratricopeptide repeat protein [Leptothermofonsia sichuanensis E412]
MNFQQFVDQLPHLYQNWGLPSVCPASCQFQGLLEWLGNPITAAAVPLLNQAVNCMAPEAVYCEIGCLWGTHVIGALYGHRDRLGYAVENPARIDPQGEMVEQLLENLTAFDLQEQVYFCAQETEEFFADLGATGSVDRIGVYFYNGASDYRSQLLGLLLVRPFLADQALIVLGQADLETVRQAAWDFLATHPQAQMLIDLSKQTGHPAFGSGLLVLSWDINTSPASSNRVQPVEEAVLHGMTSLEQHQRLLGAESLRHEAAQLVVEGQLESAERIYQKVLLYDGSHAEVWQNLGMVRYLIGKDEGALDALQVSLQLDPQNATPYQIAGLVLERLGRVDEAITAYQQAIALKPTYLDALNKLGELLARQGNLTEAEALFRRAIATSPQWSAGHVNLGNVLMQQQQWEAAIAEYRQAANLNHRDPQIWHHLSEAYRAVDDPDQAAFCQVFSLYHQGAFEQAIEEFEAHLSIDQLDTYIKCLMLYDCYSTCGRTAQVVQCAERAAQLRPDDAFLQIAPKLVLPILYQSSEELEAYRQRCLEGYRLMQQWLEPDKSQEQPLQFEAIQNFTNFYLSYQGFNDRSVYETCGRLRHQLMAKRYPGLVQPLPMPPLSAAGKIRIGYVAESLGNNSETRWAAGWLKHHDRSQFEIYCYSLDSTSDLRSEQFRLLSDVFYHLPNDLEAVCQQIRSDQLHILVFLALGTRVKIGAIASLRLAPVQCSAWGHPVTSGLPTIDYYLSSELMEPENAQEHYSEELVRLPNIGLCYPKTQLPTPTKTREDFGLRDDAVLYLSCQLIFKYLPQHDYLFAEIARRVPQAQIVFVLRSTVKNTTPAGIEQQFRQRLQRAFAAVGLEMEDYCVFLPGQDLQGYASLLNCTDVYLDTLGFSGGYTTLEALAAKLPVVCCPGELMRGRQSYGALQLLGVTDTIAYSEAEYIDIAVKLGLEPEWRQAIARRIEESHGNLFEDTACVAGLEEFYRQVVQTRLMEPATAFPESPDPPETASKLILHVGCGPYNPEALPRPFRTADWREVRLDINPAVQPDIIGSITDLSAVPNDSMDAVFSSHNLEHIYAHEVPIALGEFYRVLKPGGRVIITLPDIQVVAEYVAQGKLEEPLYESPAGPISAIDILYGLRTDIAQGNHFMAHRTAFTGDSLSQKLQQIGFNRVEIQRDHLNLWAIGHKE